MNLIYYLIILALLVAIAWFAGRRKAERLADSVPLHSRPAYYGMLTAMWCGIPALLIYAIWLAFEPAIISGIILDGLPARLYAASQGETGLLLNDILNVAHGNVQGSDPAIRRAAAHYTELVSLSHAALGVCMLSVAMAGMALLGRRITPELRARNHVEKIISAVLMLCSTIAIFTTVGIVLSVLFESIRFFRVVPVHEFLSGLKWSPQMAIRSDQAGSSGAFGAVPVLAGTVMISAIAMLIAVPTGLMSAIYLSEYAGKRVRNVVKPLLEILAGIPTVVYGFFAALVVAPFVRDMGVMTGLDVSSESALAAGLVMGIMIIPFVSSLSDDVINAVPQTMRDGSLALGATVSETVKKVVIPAALPGIVGGVLLAVSRAIGETMIVVMAAGLSAELTANPLKAVTTVTVQIVTLLVGDQEFDSPKTLAAFALGLLLFVLTLMLNIIALQIVKKYREQYE